MKTDNKVIFPSYFFANLTATIQRCSAKRGADDYVFVFRHSSFVSFLLYHSAKNDGVLNVIFVIGSIEKLAVCFFGELNQSTRNQPPNFSRHPRHAFYPPVDPPSLRVNKI